MSLSFSFAVKPSTSRPTLRLYLAIDHPPIFHQVKNQNSIEKNVSPLNQGISSFTAASSQALSLEERRPPTKEEIEEKKRTFNLWFWGGGFVAPFLATFFYFGFKFWER
jgi:hypothetical protein